VVAPALSRELPDLADPDRKRCDLEPEAGDEPQEDLGGQGDAVDSPVAEVGVRQDSM